MIGTLRPTPSVSPGTPHTTKDTRTQNTPLTLAVNQRSGNRTSNSCLPRCSTKHMISDTLHRVLASNSQHKGTHAPFIRNPTVDEDRMKSGCGQCFEFRSVP